MEIHWYLKEFNQLTPKMIWRIYGLRIQVFMIEQKSLYPDVDKRDLHAYHLYALNDEHHLVAYSRFYKVNAHEASFGRVVVPKPFRGLDLGAKLINRTLANMNKRYGHIKVVIHAQYYARGLYAKLGFKPVGKPFIEAFRKHVKMVKLI